MIALDTNVLVYAHRSLCPEHAAAVSAIERAVAGGRGWGIALPAISEFWSVVTHPRCLPRPSKASEAGDFIGSLLRSGGGTIWMPGMDFGERLMNTAVALGVAGPRIFDLQIALMAFEGGATELWSHDAAFVSVPGLPVSDPLNA